MDCPPSRGKKDDERACAAHNGRRADGAARPLRGRDPRAEAEGSEGGLRLHLDCGPEREKLLKSMFSLKIGSVLDSRKWLVFSVLGLH